MDSTLGNIRIYFGKVVSVSDEKKLCRCQISVDNYTEKIPKAELPWYFPWYGLNYLPVEGDIVPVIIFDDNFSTAFYSRKLDLKDAGLDDGDYANYLEIFKRTIEDKNVQLTYTTSKGIEFINGDGKIQIEIETLSLFVGTNSIVMTKDRIDIGDDNQEATILGDKGVEHLHNIIKHQANTIEAMMKMFKAVIKGCVSPMTLPIKVALLPYTLQYDQTLNMENSEVDSEADTLQSEKVFIQ